MCSAYVSKCASINPLYAMHFINSVDEEYDESHQCLTARVFENE